jgi:predicted DNA-binding transcriptional regulator AlpA
MGTRQVAEFLHVAESTVRSWKATGGPKENPFPEPSKYLGRCQWERAAVEAWEDQRRRRRK